MSRAPFVALFVAPLMLLPLAVASLAACHEPAAPPAPLLLDTHLEPIPAAPLVPPPPLDVTEPPSRARRRMDLDQLDATFQRVAGTQWIEAGQNQLVVLAGALGKPDYISRTTEDLIATPLFEKFIDDAARKVCADLLEADASRALPDRLFFTRTSVNQDASGDALDEQLTDLLLRFHGQNATPAALVPWRKLYLHVANGFGAPTAWSAVCSALIIHPDFYTY